jgi:hypothetical protein
MARTQTAETPAKARSAFADRPPVLDALRVLGLTDAKVARMLGVTPMYIHAWRSGRKPIPHKTHAALILVVGRLTGQIGASVPPQTQYARRAKVAVEAARLWNGLARDELVAAIGTERDYMQLVAAAFDLGQRAMARLEKADAA